MSIGKHADGGQQMNALSASTGLRRAFGAGGVRDCGVDTNHMPGGVGNMPSSMKSRAYWMQ